MACLKVPWMRIGGTGGGDRGPYTVIKETRTSLIDAHASCASHVPVHCLNCLKSSAAGFAHSLLRPLPLTPNKRGVAVFSRHH